MSHPSPGSLARSTLPLLLLVLLLPAQIVCFNFDTLTALVQRGPLYTHFGFSVSLHRDRNVSWLLVGAPLANTDQPNVDRGGAVYRCSIDSVNSCQQIAFDRTGPSVAKIRGNPVQEDDKSNQWFGATLHSTAEGPIVACAPRFVYFGTSLARRDPVGTCWISRGSFTGFYQFSPCRNHLNWGYHRQGSCQAGMSAAVSQDGKRLFVGAPGSWYWQGQLFSHNIDQMSTLATNKAPSIDDDSFLGYSVTVGEFSGDSEFDVAVGMPKGNNYTGRVAVYSASLRNVFNISGEQMGSYFGYSLATSDVNGDGFDDILIGAPLYSTPSEKDQSYEKGRVYVALQTRDHQFKINPENGFIRGKRSKARFGLSLAALGDINKDGYGDIAVGAPYDGPHGKGAVYVLLGSKKGLLGEPSQVIHAEDISDQALATFGWSLSGGLDVDENNYADLLVGAYESDRAVLLKARPVVNVTATLTITKDSFRLEERDCTTSDGTRAVCTRVKVCLAFDGDGVENSLEIHYRITLDGDVATVPRLYFLDNERQNVEESSKHLDRGSTWCREHQGYLLPTVRDKLTPINITLDYWLPPNSATYESSQAGFHYPRLPPVINNITPASLTKQVFIRKNCGRDNICKPDLELNAKLNVDEYVVGSRKKLAMSVTVKNKGEDSFETMFHMEMPYDVHYVRVNKSAAHPEIVCHGAKPEITGTNDLYCDIGNPLKGGKKVDFLIIMEPAKVNSASTPNYLFLMNVTSANGEENHTLANNQFQIGIPLRVQVDLSLHGVSEPEVLMHNYSLLDSEDHPMQPPQTLEEIGREVSHTYTVRNRGPTTISQAEITFLWPTRDLRGHYILYLVDQVQIRGRSNKGFCKTITRDDLNPLGLKSRKSGSQLIRSTRAVSGSRRRPNALKEGDNYAHYRKLIRSCGTTNCTRIECSVSDLETNDSVIFTIRSRFWKASVSLVGLDEYQISSKMVAMVTGLPYDVSQNLLQPETETTATKVFVTGVDRAEAIPWWLILAAILIGLLILATLALVLWKVGFFKRKRPPQATASDREPLRNSAM